MGNTFRILLGFVLASLLAAPALAAAPALIPVQGYLTDDQDKPLDGVFKLNLALLDDSVGGQALYSSAQPVSVVRGRFIVYLGDHAQLDFRKIAQAKSLWLEIAIMQNCGMDPSCAAGMPVNRTLAPRLQVASTAYAGVAEYCSDAQTVGGKTIDEMQSRIADLQCGSGSAVVGIQNGTPICATIAAAAAPPSSSNSSGSTGAAGPAGPQGPPGPVGPQGPKGEEGDPGPPGATGATGATGPGGPPGMNGKDGMPGADGKDGLNGQNGMKGDEGDPGPPGSVDYNRVGDAISGNYGEPTGVTASNSERQAERALGNHAHCALTQVSIAGTGEQTGGCTLFGPEGGWRLRANSGGQSVTCAAKCFF